MCISSGEIVSHLLLHCLIAYDLWVFFFCAIGITWVMLNSVKSVMESWRGMMRRCRYGTEWGAEPACILWCIWRERNQRIFEGKEMSILNLKFLFLKALFKWVTCSPTISTLSLMEFLDTLGLFGTSF